MNLRSMLGGLFKQDLPPATIATVVVVVLALFGWIIYSRTELSGAKNPPGSPGNVDPYFSGKTPRFRQNAGDGAANNPATTGRVGGSSVGASAPKTGSGATK